MLKVLLREQSKLIIIENVPYDNNIMKETIDSMRFYQRLLKEPLYNMYEKV